MRIINPYIHIVWITNPDNIEFMVKSRQENLVNLDVAVETIVNALYIPRQLGVNYSY